jgi:hypothetical protein
LIWARLLRYAILENVPPSVSDLEEAKVSTPKNAVTNSVLIPGITRE